MFIGSGWIRRWRTLARGTTLVSAILLAITACGGASSTGTENVGRTGSGGTLTLGWNQVPDTLNPALTGALSVAPIDAAIFNTLVYLTTKDQVTPDLATSWSVSSNGLQYTFNLRHGVTFQDGTPFDSAAVVTNIQYIANPTSAGGAAVGLLGPCTTATADSQYKVTIQCSQPYTPLLRQLGEPNLSMQSPTAMKTYGPNLGDHPVGTGPFELASYTPHVSLTLKRNPGYDWAPPALGSNGPAKLQNLVFTFVTNSQSQLSELQSGQAQMINRVSGAYFKTIGAQSGFRAIYIPTSGMGFFIPVDTASWPTSDLAVRRAIEYAIDKSAAIQIGDQGAFKPLWGPLQPGILGAVSYKGMYPFSTKKAEQELIAGGWTRSGDGWTKDGKPLTLVMTYPSGAGDDPDFAQAIQSALGAVGMKVSISPMAAPAWEAANLSAAFNITLSTYGAVDPDTLRIHYLPGLYFNRSHYSNPQLTSLLNRAEVETNQANRVDLYGQAQKIIMDDAVEVPLREQAALDITSSKVAGLTYSAGGIEEFYQVTIS